MVQKKMSIREKLDMLREMKERNEERRKEFLALQKQRDRNKKLFDLYVEGKISREDFESRYKE